jgi:mannose-6-phosphate isomerase-like protein (cupin superfamily)
MINYVEKIWGSEEWLVNNDKYCAKYLNLKENTQCSLHYHIKKDETFYILEGTILLELGKDGEVTLEKDSQWRILPNQVHRFRALTKTAKILEVSTTHADTDTVRIEDSRTDL